MDNQGTREAAEAVLRELPSVIGAFVREDIHGHPREVHLLVRPGPNPRHLAYDVRELLEERLGIPVDQRVISIAQLAPGRATGPLLARRAGDPTLAGPAAAPAPLPDQPASPAAAPSRPPAAPAAAPIKPPADPRVRFTGLSTQAVDNRVRVRITVQLDDTEHSGEVEGLDTLPARLHACAAATLRAVDATCVGRGRFEVEHVTTLRAFEREYVVVTAHVSSPYLGRRPIPLVGAQPVELDAESAAPLAALKAINRTLSLLLRLSGPVSRGRSHGGRS